jgi:hypothetical protein
MSGTRYDHPNCIVRREQSFTTVAGAATVGARMIMYQKGRLKAVHAYVVAAGTSASPGAALTIKIGTASVGLIALGSSTVGSTFDLTVNSDFTSDQLISATNGTDATASAVLSYEYEVQMDALQTA